MKPITEYTSYKEVTKNKRKNVTLMVLELHKQEFYQKQIAERLGISKRTVFYHTKKLLNLGYLTEIARSNIVIYRVTRKGDIAINRQQVTKILTGGERPKITIHNLPIQIPILKDSNIPDSEINEGLRNVTRHFKKLPFLGFTITKIQGKDPKIILNVHKRDIDNPSEEFNVVLQSVVLANDYLSKLGFELDISNIMVEGREMSIPDPVAKTESTAKRYTKVGLGRTVAKITPNDPPRKAYAWIDASDGRPEIESNDRTWTENYIRMPDNLALINDSIRRLADVQEVYAENIKLHMKWVKKGIELNDKILAKLNQKRIGEFL